jgi:hypothetical protein
LSEWYHTNGMIFTTQIVVGFTSLFVEYCFREVIVLKELVGCCSICGKGLYCLEGFFNGVILENKELVCFACANDETEEE